MTPPEVSLIAYESALKLVGELTCSCGRVHVGARPENNVRPATVHDIASFLDRKSLWDDLIELLPEADSPTALDFLSNPSP